MSSRSEQWSKLMSGEMVLQFALVCKGLLRLNVCNSSHLKRSKQRRPISRWRGHRMSRHYFSSNSRATTGVLIGAIFGLSSTFAQAGPCTAEIAQFEAAVRQSASNPYAGLTAPQPVGAQLDRQPTVASMKQAEQQLRSKFSANMTRAKRLDAKGDRAGCTDALNAAKRMYIF